MAGKKNHSSSVKSEAGMNIGISDKGRSAIAKGLSHLLADTYTLYLTTHNYHWNVTGPMFNSLHAMFMTQYTELWNAVDPIAERIRSLGHIAPGSYAQFGKLTSLKDAPATRPPALEMVAILVEGHEAVARTARAMFPLVDKAGDEPTADLDEQTEIEIMDELLGLNRELGTTLILVTHNLSLAEQAKQIVHIANGVVVP